MPDLTMGRTFARTGAAGAPFDVACITCRCALVRAALPRLQRDSVLPVSDVYTARGAELVMGLMRSCAGQWAVEVAQVGPD
jgi:hypothetical protein